MENLSFSVNVESSRTYLMGYIRNAARRQVHAWRVPPGIINSSGLAPNILSSFLDIRLNLKIREGWGYGNEPMNSPVEVDETCIGGKERNKHALKKTRPGGGGKGKVIVSGMRTERQRNTALNERLFITTGVPASMQCNSNNSFGNTPSPALSCTQTTTAHIAE